MNLKHLNYKIDKKKYRDIAEKYKHNGGWYQWQKFPQEDKWWKTFLSEEDKPLVKAVEVDLGIDTLDTKPRFYWLEPDSSIPSHIDDDNVTSIQINLMDEKPIIGVEGIGGVPYESLLINNGSIHHWVDPVPHGRLQLKFVMRESYEEILRRIPDEIQNR